MTSVTYEELIDTAIISAGTKYLTFTHEEVYLAMEKQADGERRRLEHPSPRKIQMQLAKHPQTEPVGFRLTLRRNKNKVTEYALAHRVQEAKLHKSACAEW